MIYVFVGLKDADNVAVARIPGDVYVTNTLGKENRRSHKRNHRVVDRQ